jgi:hypothetical protein
MPWPWQLPSTVSSRFQCRATPAAIRLAFCESKLENGKLIAGHPGASIISCSADWIVMDRHGLGGHISKRGTIGDRLDRGGPSVETEPAEIIYEAFR